MQELGSFSRKKCYAFTTLLCLSICNSSIIFRILYSRRTIVTLKMSSWKWATRTTKKLIVCFDRFFVFEMPTTEIVFVCTIFFCIIFCSCINLRPVYPPLGLPLPSAHFPRFCNILYVHIWSTIYNLHAYSNC